MPYLQDEDTHLWGHVLLDTETERMMDAVNVTLYPLPPPAPYTVGALGASLWNPDVNVVSIDTIHPQDMPLVADVLSLSCVIAQGTQNIAHCRELGLWLWYTLGCIVWLILYLRQYHLCKIELLTLSPH
jgi:hypothetical protein